jgi:hypothetical protein
MDGNAEKRWGDGLPISFSRITLIRLPPTAEAVNQFHVKRPVDVGVRHG